MSQHQRDGSLRSLNTTISAVAVIASIVVRARRLAIELRHQHATGRSLTFEEYSELYTNDQSPEEEVRLIVYENLDAAVALPAGFPNGPYDERFGRDGDYLSRIFVGSEIGTIERDEGAAGIQYRDSFRLLRSA